MCNLLILPPSRPSPSSEFSSPPREYNNAQTHKKNQLLSLSKKIFFINIVGVVHKKQNILFPSRKKCKWNELLTSYTLSSSPVRSNNVVDTLSPKTKKKFYSYLHTVSTLRIMYKCMNIISINLSKTQVTVKIVMDWVVPDTVSLKELSIKKK